jgi:hypothetical protein
MQSGDVASLRRFFAGLGDFERNGSLSTAVYQQLLTLKADPAD